MLESVPAGVLVSFLAIHFSKDWTNRFQKQVFWGHFETIIKPTTVLSCMKIIAKII